MGNAESEPQDMPTRGLEPPSQFLSDSVREKTPVEYEIEEPGEDMMEEAEEMLSEPPPNLTTHTGRRLSLETHTTGFEDLELDALDTVEEAKSTPTKLQVGNHPFPRGETTGTTFFMPSRRCVAPDRSLRRRTSFPPRRRHRRPSR